MGLENLIAGACLENVRLSRRDANRHAGAPPHSSLQKIDRLRWP